MLVSNMKSVEQSPAGGQGKNRVSILIVTAERTHRRIVGGRGRRWKVVPEQGEDEGGRGSLRRLAVSQMCSDRTSEVGGNEQQTERSGSRNHKQDRTVRLKHGNQHQPGAVESRGVHLGHNFRYLSKLCHSASYEHGSEQVDQDGTYDGA